MYQKYSIAPIDSNELVPKYLIGENGIKKDTLGIVISLKQAQKIDYDYDLLNLSISKLANMVFIKFPHPIR
jgi:hypothetical protein